MFELKALSKEAIPSALEKGMRYRLLGQPREAESIYLDVLGADEENQAALVGLLLSLSDQFDHHSTGLYNRARELLSHLKDPYERAYYAGICCERRGNAILRQAGPDHERRAYGLWREAMAWYEQAEPLRPPGDDDPLLRWNACARSMTRHHRGQSGPEERYEPYTDG